MTDELNKCVWMWAGLLTYRLCDRGYDCEACPVDALFRTRQLEGPTSRVPTPMPTTGARLVGAPDRFHDPQHLWLRVLPEGQVQIGLDPMAARLLSPAEGFSTPRPGTHLRRGDRSVVAQLPEGQVSFASPLTGHVVRTHRMTTERIRAILSRPYSRAWLFILSVPRLERQLARFLFGRDASVHLARDWEGVRDQCFRLTVGGAGDVPALPDGGELDPERLYRCVGSGYATLVGQWIGDRRFLTGRAQTRPTEERTGNPGGADNPPEER
jgi:glycine cleavage system H lipoate-binding protein